MIPDQISICGQSMTHSIEAQIIKAGLSCQFWLRLGAYVNASISFVHWDKTTGQYDTGLISPVSFVFEEFFHTLDREAIGDNNDTIFIYGGSDWKSKAARHK